MRTTQINIRVDSAFKTAFEDVVESLRAQLGPSGTNTSNGISILAVDPWQEEMIILPPPTSAVAM
jgi:hypothetical protein